MQLAFRVHPRVASRFKENEDLPRLRGYLQGSKVVALEEVGVDFSFVYYVHQLHRERHKHTKFEDSTSCGLSEILVGEGK